MRSPSTSGRSRTWIGSRVTGGHALGITNIDPIPHGLLFERFLNPERPSAPDIDIDFDDRRRGEMVRYAAERWGGDRVAQVITFGTIKTKAALKVLPASTTGSPVSPSPTGSQGAAAADHMGDIPLSGITDPSHERYKEAAEVRGLIDTDPDVRTIYETPAGWRAWFETPAYTPARWS